MFREAQPCLEYAAFELENDSGMPPDIAREQLGTCVHAVGYCLANQGKLEDAQPWFERARELGFDD
jgi:methylmalonyl-CoA mutase cobalamin-binding subunit